MLVALTRFTKRTTVGATEFFDVPLTRSRGGRPMFYPKVPGSLVRSNFLTYRNLKNLNLPIDEFEGFCNANLGIFSPQRSSVDDFSCILL